MKNDRRVAVSTDTKVDVMQIASVSFIVAVSLLSVAALIDTFLISFAVSVI